MGFLDHSTSNIIIDAVLTDVGRRRLARIDGSFEISYFGLGDDEIDYNIIKNFGRTVGKEKIEKNTPIFEAQTRSNLAQKYLLRSVPNTRTIDTLPLLTLDVTNNLIALKRSSANNVRVINVTIKNTDTQIDIPEQLKDNYITVELDNRFLSLLNPGTAIDIKKNNIASFEIGTSKSTNSEISSKLQFSLKRIIDSDFAKFSRVTGDYIRTFVKITGNTSGVSKVVEVRIS